MCLRRSFFGNQTSLRFAVLELTYRFHSSSHSAPPRLRLRFTIMTSFSGSYSISTYFFFFFRYILEHFRLQIEELVEGSCFFFGYSLSRLRFGKRGFLRWGLGGNLS